MISAGRRGSPSFSTRLTKWRPGSFRHRHCNSSPKTQGAKMSFPKQQQTNRAQVSAEQVVALAGTNGTPGAGNKFVTESDSRMTVLPVLRTATFPLSAFDIRNGKQLLGAPGVNK